MEWLGSEFNWQVPDISRLLQLAILWLGGSLVVRVMLDRWVKPVVEKAQEGSDRSARERKQRADTVGGVIQTTAIVGLTVAVGLEGLSALGFDIRPLLTGAGIAGLAIGFGAQSLVRDVINGLFILIEGQLELGDVVEINGIKGKVMEFNLRRTVLRDEDGIAHHIPNSSIGRVANMTQGWSKTNVVVSVGYKEDMDRVIKLLKEVGEVMKKSKQFQGLLKADPEVQTVEELSGGVMKFKLILKVEAGKQWSLKRAALAEVKKRFDKEKIELK